MAAHAWRWALNRGLPTARSGDPGSPGRPQAAREGCLSWSSVMPPSVAARQQQVSQEGKS